MVSLPALGRSENPFKFKFQNQFLHRPSLPSSLTGARLDEECRHPRTRKGRRVSYLCYLAARISSNPSLACTHSITGAHTTFSDASEEGSNDDLDGMPIVLPEDRIKHLESQTQALEMQLAYRSEDTANTVAECEAIREELADATQKYESERKMSIDVARSMTRQYKGMQEDLLNKINDRERCIEALKDELEKLKAVHRKKLADKDDVIQQKDADAAKKRVEVEDLCKHFANLLAEARLRLVANTQDKDFGSVKTAG